ncbi:hypothetical protein F511_38114 [Dorcoceras hygrometricum]|uniref:Dystroglycan-like n=1 Tax=Dorcoceras hygrometricum TaxID=472368 RepID=A0A2Z7BUE8_9LAMI|nr:hypothetical protein F511_38114 [Dorcoceras hygrometricum]
MDDHDMVSMFEALMASGLRGFLGCPAVVYEDALVDFFENASVRSGVIISTVGGQLLEISEELFAEYFELPVDGLGDLSEMPKDAIFDARSIVSLSGEPVSLSGRKNQMKMPFLLICDIVAKAISAKAGSFNAITVEKFSLITAVVCRIKMNWAKFLFSILKKMVSVGSKQAKGFAIQISLLLATFPSLELEMVLKRSRGADLSEMPKDAIFDARSIVSLSGEPISLSGRKNQMKMPFRLLCDIMAKAISVKAGSFNAITVEKFSLIMAGVCRIKMNWAKFLFSILKKMVSVGSKQAKGFAIQISLLLATFPSLELGESSEFSGSKVLTKNTVLRFVSINDRDGAEEVTGAAKKKAVSKKRPAAAVGAAVPKKKRSFKKKSVSSMELVEVAEEAIPIQQVLDETRAADAPADTAQPAVSEEKHWFDLPYDDLVKQWEAERPVVTASDTEEDIATVDVAPADGDQQVEEFVAPISAEVTLSANEQMSLGWMILKIPVDIPLPSTCMEVTKITMGKANKIPGVSQWTWFLKSLPCIPTGDKGKEVLVEKDPVKGNPAEEHYSLICADIDLLLSLRAQVLDETRAADAPADIAQPEVTEERTGLIFLTMILLSNGRLNVQWSRHLWPQSMQAERPVVTASDTEDEIATVDVAPADGDQQVQEFVAPISAEDTLSADEQMSLDDILLKIPVDIPLPSTCMEVTKITMGKSIKIPGVSKWTWFLQSLPSIPVNDKGKQVLVEKDPVKGNPAAEHYSLICADIEFLVSLRAQVIDEVASFFHSFSLKKLATINFEEMYRKEEQVLSWGETESPQEAIQRKFYILLKYRTVLVWKFLDAWRANFVPGQGSSAVDIQVIELLSDLYLYFLEELAKEARNLNLIWNKPCFSKIFDGSPRDRGAVIARTNSNTRSLCWIRKMILVDGMWKVEHCADRWIKIPWKVISTVVSRQRQFDDTIPSMSVFFRLMKKRWADVCLEVTDFCASRRLLPVGSINFCRALEVVATDSCFASRQPTVFSLRLSQFCTIQIQYSLFSSFSTADISDFLSSIALDRTTFRSVQIAQSVVPSVQLSLHQRPSSPISPESSSSLRFDQTDIDATASSRPTISPDLSAALADFQAALSEQMFAFQSEISSRMHKIEQSVCDSLRDQADIFRNLSQGARQEVHTLDDVHTIRFNEFRKNVLTQNAFISRTS